MVKAQSAMEYLTTYGWAILIVMIAMVSLYTIGAFNPSAYNTSALPGACQVARPYGAGSSQLVDLEGLCNNAVPKYTAYFNGAANILITNTSLTTANSITITAWVRTYTNTQPWMIFDRGLMGTAGSFYIYEPASSAPAFVIDSPTGSPTSVNFGSSPFTDNAWYFVAATFNPVTGNQITYVNGVQSNYVVGGSLGMSTSNIMIGSYLGGGDNMMGYVGAVQFYNTSLSANEISALYVLGVGKDPIQLQNLVGWWPLNGDVKDYSGDGDSGSSNTISFNPGWSSTYSAP